MSASDLSETMTRIAAAGAGLTSAMRAREMRPRPPHLGPLAPPATETESCLATIWSEVLQVTPVGVRDNFFQLGGNSLMITQIAFQVREVLGFELPMHAIFQSPTIAALAEQIGEAIEERVTALSDEEVEAELRHLRAEIWDAEEPVAAVETRCAIRPGDLVFAPAGSGVWCYSRNSGKALVIDAATADTLQKWNPARAPELPEQQVAALRDAGVLVEESSLWPVPLDCEIRADKVEIGSAGCVTRDRPQAAARAVSSYLLHFAQHGHAPRAVVVDDSAEPAVQQVCRDALGAIERPDGAWLGFAGTRQKRALARALGAQGIPPEVVEFALFGCGNPGISSSGANRNALLLATAGEATLSFDDDTVCSLVSPPRRLGGLRLTSGNAPAAGLWSYPDRETAMSAFRFIEIDLLAAHEELLGRTVCRCAGGSAALDLSAAGASFLKNADTRKVRISLNGVAGDCGWGSPLPYLLVTGESRARLMASDEAFARAAVSRNVLQVASQATIAERSEDMMSTVFAYDQREVLPPFLPAGRGSDHVFATAIATCDPSACFAHVPCAVLHLPVEARSFWPEEILRSASGIDFALLITTLIHSFECGWSEGGVGERLARVGRYLDHGASQPAPDFAEWCRVAAGQQRAAWLARLDASVPADAEGAWAKHVRAFCDETHRSLSHPDFWLPLDIAYGLASDEAARRTQKLVKQTGELFRWWPAIVEAGQRGPSFVEEIPCQ